MTQCHFLGGKADPTEATYLYEIVRRGGAVIIYR